MNKSFRKLLITTAMAGVVCFAANAQMPGPGAQRDMDRIKEMQRGSVLRKDSVKLIDVITVVDPESGGEEQQVVDGGFDQAGGVRGGPGAGEAGAGGGEY